MFGVSISGAALQERADDPALRRALHEELLEDLSVHGHLVFTCAEDLEIFVQAVREMPTSLAKAWEAILSSRRVSVEVADPAVRPGLGELLDSAVLETRLAPTVSLVLVEADQAELLGVPIDEFSTQTPGGLIEIGRITTAGRTTTCSQRAMSSKPHCARAAIARWSGSSGSARLCSRPDPTVIYDKYAGQQVARRYVHETQNGDGLSWFLSRVGMHPGRKVRVITSVTDDRAKNGDRFDEEVMSLAFGRLLQALGRQVSLDLVLVPERVRGHGKVERFGHDRHIRFGDRAVLALGTGLQAFATTHFPETITVARLPVADARVREERATKAAIRPPAGGWLGWIHEAATGA